jgi:16S rRNA (guanine527-N7)-methyltransferase
MTFDAFKDILLEAFPDVKADQLDRFRRMEALYQEWNARINVISRKDMDALYDHHVLHSLAIAKYVSLLGEGFRSDEPHTVLDLGTGGGFPGIPLAILLPQWRFTLCDSVGKKTLVAQAVAGALGLENVEVVNARAESLQETYDFVVSRAVTTLDRFFSWIEDKFTKAVFYLKGGDINPEISDLLRKFSLQPSAVHAWKVDSWIKDDYFSEKFVIHIEKNYLCSPKSAKYKNKR